MLQADGVEATDAAPPGQSLAFTTTSVTGDTVLGFQLGQSLPDRCFKCARPEPGHRLRLAITARRDVIWRLSEAAAGRVDWLSAPSRERIALELPYCQPCLDQKKRASRLRWLAMVSPLLALILAGAITALTGASFGPILVLMLIAAGVLAFLTRMARSRTRIDILDIDETGFIRIAGIHHDTAQDVVDRATAGQ